MPKIELRIKPRVDMAPRRAFELAVAIRHALAEVVEEELVHSLFQTGFEIEVRVNGAYQGEVGFRNEG